MSRRFTEAVYSLARGIITLGPDRWNLTVLSEILAARVFGSSKIPQKKIIRKMLDLVANARQVSRYPLIVLSTSSNDL